ncbi:MAG TPA: tRNA epoxyqueuosine(34) reductase QueG [Symbiobacteriaceae bacterium]|nr:tRNA epoxyqueuosine(34) reductase QueG [Symbiobacteriaceae bacterium]
MQLLKDRLIAYGREIGLDLVGVAPAEPFLQDRERLHRRKSAGMGPNPYEYQEIDPRVYPDLLLPGVQSIIAAGISYLMEDDAPPPPEDGPALKGWLSRYCRGLDYHQLLKDRLTRLAQWLEQEVPGCKTLVYVDTGPPLDRAVAERAGIGKWGKHTNLITREYGTWVFLGEMLTDLPLPADTPIEAACGECRLCIDACPTQCITDWQMDAMRCLSYVTQMKGIIPEEYRETMGNRLFGCDDCQDVCPYNKRAKRGRHPEFAPNPEVGGEPNLLQLMAMTKGDFKRWFEPTAAGWRGKTTIQRNAVIALGNSGHPDALEPLVGALASESQPIRAHAAWGLGRLARLAPAVAPAAQAALTARQAREQAPAVLLEINNALESLAPRA